LPDKCYPLIFPEQKRIAESLVTLKKILDLMISAMAENNDENTSEYYSLHKNEFKKLESLIYITKKRFSDIHITTENIISDHDFTEIQNKYLHITKQIKIKKLNYRRELSEIDLRSRQSKLFNVPESRYININS